MERLDKFTLIFVLVFAFLSVHSLFQSGLPPTHDGEYHVIRFHQFYETLSSGNIYPRWASRLNNGYGLPLFNYVYPLPNYVAAILHFFNVSFIDAFKYNLIIATAFGGLFFTFLSAFISVDLEVLSEVSFTFSRHTVSLISM
jgi:uncharacterized membrane protein